METENPESNMSFQSHIGIMKKCHINIGLEMNLQEAYIQRERTHYASISIHYTIINVTCYINKNQWKFKEEDIAAHKDSHRKNHGGGGI